MRVGKSPTAFKRGVEGIVAVWCFSGILVFIDMSTPI